MASEPSPSAAAPIDPVGRVTAMASLLSLDVVRPFYGAMGLVLAEPDGLQEALRAIMVRGRQQYRETKTLIDVMAELRRTIAVREGEARAEQFQRWFDHLYLDIPAHQRQWSWWSEAFEIGLATGNHAPEVPLLGGKHKVFVTMYREAMDLQELRNQAEVLKASPLSDWDLEIYVRRGYDHDDFAMDDPFHRTFAIVRLARLQLVVRELLKALSPSEQQRLHKDARRTIAKLEPRQPLEPLTRLTIGHMAPP